MYDAPYAKGQAGSKNTSGDRWRLSMRSSLKGDEGSQRTFIWNTDGIITHVIIL